MQQQQHPVFTVSPDVLSARSDVDDDNDNDRTPTQQDAAETAGF
ncbi:unnamed protein product [Dibothriocephalus latus]|uniref:Uncharacterized protein n=1 Tax=Dibothriocephalus latus TaxID=60516 RepID=A0A3P6QHT8_DIBLA|nr:unnamed protein product [Dibothriocephalus latus]